MTPVLVLTPALLILVLSLWFTLRVLLRLHRPIRSDEASLEWLTSFSADRYHPMQRLFDDEDFAFLSRQPGFDLALYRKLRRERLRIFWEYLDRLISDFNRLHAGTRLLLAATPGEHSELLVRLVKLKWSFSAAVLRAEINYLLCCAGFRTLAVRALIVRLEEMTAQASAILAMQTAQALIG